MTSMIRFVGTALITLVLTAILTALGITSSLAAAVPPQAAAPVAEPVSVSALAAQLVTVGPVKMGGCGYLDVICDPVKDEVDDAIDCGSDPIDCAKDKGNEIKEGVEDEVGGAVDCVKNPSVSGCLKAGTSVVPNPLKGCGLLSSLCDAAPGGLPGVGGMPGLPGVPGLTLGSAIPGIDGIPDPLTGLADIIAKAAADAWTAAMLAIWSAGLFVLRIILMFSEIFLTPDLRSNGPGKDVYSYAMWIALSLVTIMTLLQLGVAAFKRDGKSLARAGIGSAQFVMVTTLWFGYCGIVVAACGGLTKALMRALLKVNTWSGWDPLPGLSLQTVTDGTVATVLGFLGLVLWLAALGHMLVYLARAASLLVLVATGPVSAAGLVSDAGHPWFWKSLRWFHAAAFTPVVMVTVLGIGVQMANGVAAHLSDGSQKAIGTALPAVMLICISCVAPLALFKLLAFVDPGTPSGASFRQGLSMQGLIPGLPGGSGGGMGGATNAQSADSNGRSSGEESAEASTGNRFSQGIAGKLGGGFSAGVGMVQSLGAKGTALMSDQSNQAGVGHQTYGPSFDEIQAGRGNNGQQGGGQPQLQDAGGPGPDDDVVTPPSMPTQPPTPPTMPTPPGGGGGGGGKPGGGGTPSAPTPAPAGAGAGAGGGAGAGAAGGVAAIPPVV